MLGNYKDIEMWGLSLCDGLISGIRRNLDEGEREEMERGRDRETERQRERGKEGRGEIEKEREEIFGRYL